MHYVIIVLIAIAAILFGVGSAWVAAKEHKERKETEKKLNEAYEHETKAAKIIDEANATKQDAISGDIDSDLNYMAGKLHDYAKK
jgi:hypothetical protein